GPVYGVSTAECDIHDSLLPNFHYDDLFGTVVNRFLVQSVTGMPLTVFGKGGQTRGYLNLIDTLQCLALAADNPPKSGEMKIYNQFTETLSVNDIASKIARVGNGLGLNVTIQPIDNPRKELEDHYYNPVHTGLLNLGLKPHFMTDEILANMLERIIKAKERIVTSRIMPRVRWD
ncbi:NAD-dependent dehydratase, partial [Alphaproteobacteria bacterium]|nr:NAD-dependent dehydratase [Alphaproteobacteria bacterium]